MIDIHAHILPGLDDGAQDFDTAIAMARIAVKDGIKSIIATPHVIKGAYDNSRLDIIKETDNFNRVLKENKILLNIMPGAEYRLEPELLEKLEKGEILTLNDTGRYLLVELPATYVPPFAETVLYKLQLKGVTPILAHPERNEEFMDNPLLLKEMADRGILMQVTAGSLIGIFGKKVQSFALSIIKNGWAAVIASDAHSTGRRSPILSAACAIIEKNLPKVLAEEICYRNPQFIMGGTDIQISSYRKTSAWWQNIMSFVNRRTG